MLWTRFCGAILINSDTGRRTGLPKALPGTEDLTRQIDIGMIHDTQSLCYFPNSGRWKTWPGVLRPTSSMAGWTKTAVFPLRSFPKYSFVQPMPREFLDAVY